MAWWRPPSSRGLRSPCVDLAHHPPSPCVQHSQHMSQHTLHTQGLTQSVSKVSVSVHMMCTPHNGAMHRVSRARVPLVGAAAWGWRRTDGGVAAALDAREVDRHAERAAQQRHCRVAHAIVAGLLAARLRQVDPRAVAAAFASRRALGAWAQLQLQGAKRWHLCPPTPVGARYCGGDVDDPDATYARCGSGAPATEEAAIGCLDAVLQPGEVLYYPERWWHRTSNAGTGSSPMVSVSRSLVTPVNARAMASALQLYCRRALEVAREAYAPTCLALMPCLRRWAAILDDAYGSVVSQGRGYNARGI